MPEECRLFHCVHALSCRIQQAAALHHRQLQQQQQQQRER